MIDLIDIIFNDQHAIKVLLQFSWRRGSNPACSGTGVKDSRPALSRLGDYLKYKLSFIIINIY